MLLFHPCSVWLDNVSFYLTLVDFQDAYSAQLPQSHWQGWGAPGLPEVPFVCFHHWLVGAAKDEDIDRATKFSLHRLLKISPERLGVV